MKVALPCSVTIALALANTVCPIAVFAEQAPPGSASEQEVFAYSVLEGDTCESIARQVYGHERYYYIIVEYNPGPSSVLRSSCNQYVQPGMTLRLPRRVPQSRREPDAKVSAVLREVRSRPPETEQWQKAQPGQNLFRGWRVNTLERSEAQLTFRDESSVHLRQETLVIIYGPSAGDARRRTSKATLERGTLRAKLGELSGRKRLKVETPTALASLNSGEAVVSVDEEETSRVSNHTGRPAQVANRKGGGEVLVRAGMGTTVRRGKSPAPPRPLPAAPRWVVSHPTLFVTLEGMDSTISGAWQPVTGATHYRIELSSGPDGDGPVGTTGVPARVTNFELRGFPAGPYHMSLSTIGTDGLESARSTTRVINVVELELRSPPYAPLLPEQEGEHRRVLAGTTLIVPQGLTCSFGDGEPATELLFSGRGVVTLHCQSTDRQRAPRMLVEVVPLSLAPRLAGHDEPLSRLNRGDRVNVLLEGLDTRTLLDSALAVVGGPGLRVDSFELTSTRTLRVSVAVAPDAPPESYLELQLRPRDARRVVLGRAMLRVDPSQNRPIDEVGDPRVSGPAPEEPFSRALTEPSSLVVGPSSFGVRDERRGGSGLWAALSYATSFGERPSQLSPTLGFRLATLRERLRVDLGIPVPLEGQPGGLTFDISSRITAGEAFGASLDLGIWFPFALDDRTNRYTLRLVPSTDLSFRVGDRVTLRTRQGFMADAGIGGLLAWASAYAVDVWVVGPLTLGVEATLLLGAIDGNLVAAPTASFAVGLEAGPLAFTVACRYSFTSDTESLYGRFAVMMAMRATSGR